MLCCLRMQGWGNYKSISSILIESEYLDQDFRQLAGTYPSVFLLVHLHHFSDQISLAFEVFLDHSQATWGKAKT